MRILTMLLLLVGLTATAFADAHSEMAAALAAQADQPPSSVTLPTHAAAPQHAAASSAVKRGIDPRNASDASGRAANQSQNASQTVVHQAQAAAAAAAGQSQAQAAKQRATQHPHPHP